MTNGTLLFAVIWYNHGAAALREVYTVCVYEKLMCYEILFNSVVRVKYNSFKLIPIV